MSTYDSEPPVFVDSAGNSLGQTEVDILAHALHDNPELAELEEQNTEMSLRYLKWGKYLFDHSIVSEYDLIKPDGE